MDCQFHVSCAFTLSKAVFSLEGQQLLSSQILNIFELFCRKLQWQCGGMKYLTLLGCERCIYTPCHSSLTFTKLCYM